MKRRGDGCLASPGMVRTLSLPIHIPCSESNTNVMSQSSHFHNPPAYQQFLDLQFHSDVDLAILY